MGFDEFSNTAGLLLALGFPSKPGAAAAAAVLSHKQPKNNNPRPAGLFCFPTSAAESEPSLTLGLSTTAAAADSGGQSPVSSNSGGSGGRSVKRELREVSGGSDQDIINDEEKGGCNCRVSDEDELLLDGSTCNVNNNSRKKLRLTKQQSALLEQSFKLHTTLNPKEKQALATDLNLRPRQVEVWFQNRRARTKLKQTEVDCEFLKRCCETLTDENRRLQKELQELKALKLAQPLFMQMPAATLSICPSCDRIAAAAATVTADGKSKPPFSMSPKPLFYKPFTNPSAAC